MNKIVANLSFITYLTYKSNYILYFVSYDLNTLATFSSSPRLGPGMRGSK